MRACWLVPLQALPQRRATFALAPGISVDALLEYSRYKSNDAAGPDVHGIGIGSGTAVTF